MADLYFLFAVSGIFSGARLENENLKQLLKDVEDRAEERRLLDLKVAEERRLLDLKAAEERRLSDLKVAEERAEKLLKAAEDHLQVSEERAERRLQSTLGIIYPRSFCHCL
jgi:hypothetical protein